MTWGPLVPTIGPCERAARLRELRAVVRLVVGPERQVLAAIGRALSAPGGMVEVETAIDGLPALTRRRVLAAYAELAKEPAARGWAMTQMQVANANDVDPLVEALKRTRADVVAKMRTSAAETGRVDAGWVAVLASTQTALAAIEATQVEAASA